MARLGMTHVTALHLFEKRELTKGLEIKFLMSHLSSPDDPSNLVNSRQLKRVKVIRKYALNIPFSLVSSSGIFLSEDYFFDLARPGMALYGLNPTPYTVNPMQNAVELTSKIIQIRNIYTRSSVGYGATYYAKKKQVLAVIAIGYSDGFFRSLSNKGECYIDGHIVPVVGRVSMDLVTLDVTNVPEYKLSPGVYVEVFGKNIPVESVAAKAGTSSYEILTSTRSNYQRVYSISEKAKYEFC
jgi:alanine racemase